MAPPSTGKKVTPKKNMSLVASGSKSSATSSNELMLEGGFSWDGKTLRSLEDVVSTYRTLGETEQQVFLNSSIEVLNHRISAVEEGFLGFDDFLDKELQGKGIDREKFLQEYQGYANSVDLFRKNRDKKNECMKRLMQFTDGIRGTLFRTHFMTDITANNALRGLGKIFETYQPVAKAIQVLNHFTVQEGMKKLQGNKVRGRKFVGFSSTIVHATIQTMKDDPAWHDSLALPDQTILNTLGLQQSQCGLLIAKEKMIYLAEYTMNYFDDETERWEFVVPAAQKMLPPPAELTNEENLTRGPGPRVESARDGEVPEHEVPVTPETQTADHHDPESSDTDVFESPSPEMPRTPRTPVAKKLTRGPGPRVNTRDDMDSEEDSPEEENSAVTNVLEIFDDTKKDISDIVQSFPEDLQKFVLKFYESTMKRLRKEGRGEVLLAQEGTARAVKQIMKLHQDEFSADNIMQFFIDHKKLNGDYYVLEEKSEDSTTIVSMECCQVPLNIKMILQHGDRFKIVVTPEMKTRLSKFVVGMFEDFNFDKFCALHERQYAQYCGLATTGLNNEDVSSNIYKLCTAPDPKLFLLHPGNHAIVATGNRMASQVKKDVSLGFAKFKVAPEALKLFHDVAWTPARYDAILTSDRLTSFRSKGFLNMPKLFSCAFLSAVRTHGHGSRAKTSFLTLAREELEMYRHHFRVSDKKPAPPSAFLHNMTHSLIQQTLRMHHGLYLGALLTRHNSSHKLVTYPEPAQFVGVDHHSKIVATRIDANTRFVRLTPGPGSRVSPPDNRTIDYHVIPAAKQSTGQFAVWEKSHESSILTPTRPKNAQWISINLARSAVQRKELNTKQRTFLEEYVSNETVPFSVFTRQGTFVDLDSEREPGKGGFLTISNNYTEVVGNEALENGVDLEDFLIEAISMKRPRTARWSVTGESSAKFRATLGMTKGGPLSEALVGRRPWNDPLVVMMVKDLFAKDITQLTTYLKKHEQELFEDFANTWKMIQQLELQLYGDKSWAKTKGTDDSIEADNMIDEVILLEKYSTKKPRAKTPEMTPGPGPRLDLEKGKDKELVSVESPAASPSAAGDSPEDDNDDEDDDNDDATTQVSLPVSRSRHTTLASARSTEAPATPRPASSDTNSDAVRRSGRSAKRVLSGDGSPRPPKRTKEN
ncbi:hypothetical protein PZA11_006393 [Diplocarpon coronariae]